MDTIGNGRAYCNSLSCKSDYPEVKKVARALHEDLFIADMHSDALMWRDVSEDHNRGHVNLQRLKAGNIKLQVFAMNSVFRFKKNYKGCYETQECGCDVLGIGGISLSRGWGVDAFQSSDCLHRLHKQSEWFHETVASRTRDFLVIKTPEDIQILSNKYNNKIGAMLSLEGVHGLGKSDIKETVAIQRLEDYYNNHHLRMMSLTHRFDISFGGSSEGCSRYGLTTKGKAIVERGFEIGILLDVAHSSRTVISEVAEKAFQYKKPIVVSHTGIYGTRAIPRNIHDRGIEEVALTGGIIGIGLWKRALPKPELETFSSYLDVFVDNILYTVQLLDSVRMRCAVKKAGFEKEFNPFDHVALGSDYDGMTNVVLTPDQMVYLTNALMERGVSKRNIRKIMGENTARVFRQGLKKSSPSQSEKDHRLAVFQESLSCFQ